MYENDTFTVRPPMPKYHLTNPFDSWYVGGILFMCIVILVLLYANFYRENAFQLMWTAVLTKLRLKPRTPSVVPPSHTIDPLLI